MEFEKDIENVLVRCTETQGGMCIKLSPEHYAGIPDRLLVLPSGQVIWVELKRQSGRVGKLQVWWERKLRRLGHMYVRAWSREDVGALQEYMATRESK